MDRKDQILISFLMSSIFSEKFVKCDNFWSQVKKTPRAFIGSVGHLIPRGLLSLSFSDPVHNPSVLALFTFKPENSLKLSSNWKSL